MSGFQTDAGTVQQEAGFGFNGRFFTESFNAKMTALAGGGQSKATQIDSMVCMFTTVANAGDSAQLPASQLSMLGAVICVVNTTGKPMQVFAQNGSSDTINGIAGSTGVVHMPQSVVYYSLGTLGQWQAQGIGSGYSGNFTTQSFADALTAQHTSPSQTTGTLLTTGIARFTTVQSNGDAALLPPAAGGLYIAVINAGASIMNVYPASQGQGGATGGDQINSLGQNNPFAVPAGATAEFFTTVGGQWHTTLTNTALQQNYGTAANTTGFTATGAQVAGGTVEVTLNLTGTLGAGANIQMSTVAAMVTAMTAAGVNPAPGQTIALNIINSSGANFAWTVTTNTGWTLNGTMTIAQNTQRRFYMTLTTLSAAVLQSLGQTTLSAVV